MTTQYWEPPALVERLTVGTRVRIRVSPECRLGCLNGCQPAGHHERTGAEGVVVAVYPVGVGAGGTPGYVGTHCPVCNEWWSKRDTPSEMGHRFRVGIKGRVFAFAAVELTPLEES